MRRSRRTRRLNLSVTAWVGLVLTVVCIGIALLGPFFAPYDPAELLGLPFESPSQDYLFGLDYLGRDALSRFLWGGRTAIVLALVASMIGTLVGVFAGILAAYTGGALDAVFNRSTEVLLAFPGLIFILLLVSSFGNSLPLLIAAVALGGAPRVARLVRGAALEIRELSFVEVAESRGERRTYIVTREILPNILAPIGVDFGIRFAYSIIVVASVSFLGLGLQPPAADWGLIISENRSGLEIQPWAIIGPIAAIGILTVGINLLMDGIRRAASVRTDPESELRS